MSRKIKFYLDEHVSRAVLQGLRERGVDVKTVSEAGLHSASDNAHVQHARAERRVIFSQDSDFLRLHAAGARMVKKLELAFSLGVTSTPQRSPPTYLSLLSDPRYSTLREMSSTGKR